GIEAPHAGFTVVYDLELGDVLSVAVTLHDHVDAGVDARASEPRPYVALEALFIEAGPTRLDLHGALHRIRARGSRRVDRTRSAGGGCHQCQRPQHFAHAGRTLSRSPGRRFSPAARTLASRQFPPTRGKPPIAVPTDAPKRMHISPVSSSLRKVSVLSV